MSVHWRDCSRSVLGCQGRSVVLGGNIVVASLLRWRVRRVMAGDMPVSAEGKTTVWALIGLGGTGALYVFPHPYADIVGWSLVAIFALGLPLVVAHHFKIKINRGNVIVGVAVTTMLLVASFSAWYFWPTGIFNSNDNSSHANVEVRDVNYPDGTIVAGLRWDHRLTDIRLHINNSSDHDYGNIDFLVQTDLVIAVIAQEPNISKCYFSAPRRLMPNMLYGKDQTAKDITIPLEPPTTIQAVSSIYRGQCDRLPPRTELEVVLGVSPFKFGVSNSLGNSRASPAWIEVDLNYETNGLSQKESFKKCFVTNCPGLDGHNIRFP
jgi:hypothetical protein